MAADLRRAGRSFRALMAHTFSEAEQEVKFIFGIPGGKIMPVFDVLDDEGPRLIVCRHGQFR